MTTYLLDTDTITKLLKKHPGNQPVVDRFRREIQRNSLFVICPVVYYEMRRGLLFKGARTQLVAFEKLAGSMAWKEFNAPIWDRACSLWFALRARGRSHNDADVLIAAHALHYGAVIVSANLEHFQGTGASVESWDEPLVKS
jgi:tRNA(fMet)-specific endonuclease VapC